MTKRLLYFVQLPPPPHGSAMVSERVIGLPALQGRLNARVLPIRFSKDVADLERFSLRKLLYAILLLLRLAIRLLTFRPHYVYFTIAPTGLAFVRDAIYVAAIKAAGATPILHIHGRGIGEISRRSGRWRRLCNYVFGRSVIINASPVLLESEFSLIDLSAARSVIIANSVPEAALPAVEKSGPPRILFLSATWPFKGLGFLFEAAAQLKQAGRAFHIDVVGGSRPEHDEAWARSIARLGLGDIVTLHGMIYGTEKLAFFARADIFCHPTTRDYSPLVIVEAMAAGLPVVASGIGGIVDLVADRKSGLLVVPRDVAGLVQALACLIDDVDLREKFGREGRSRYEAVHHPDRFESAIVSLYEELGLI